MAPGCRAAVELVDLPLQRAAVGFGPTERPIRHKPIFSIVMYPRYVHCVFVRSTLPDKHTYRVQRQAGSTHSSEEATVMDRPAVRQFMTAAIADADPSNDDARLVRAHHQVDLGEAGPRRRARRRRCEGPRVQTGGTG